MKTSNRNELYYYIAFGISGLFLLCGAVAYTLYFKNYIQFPMCLIYRLTGIYCPACGGTRAVLSLLEGHPMESFLCNPVVIYAVCVWCIYMGINTVILLCTHAKGKMIHFTRKYVFVGLVLLLLNFIMKNAA